MSTIVTRAGKGTPLTNNEVDANFTNLNTDKIETITSTDGSVTVTSSGTSRDLSVAVVSSTNNVVVQVRNATGATLTKGTVVYITGATGQNPTVSKALATSDATSAQTLGMISADLPNNTNGNVTIIGLITNIDTSAYTDGQQLYLSGTTAGTVTATKPYAPIHLVYVAVVEHAHPTQGKLFVKVQNGYELDEIHDVSAVSPTNGQTLVYNSTTSLWEKSNAPLIVGATIDNTIIGANTPAAGTFSSMAVANAVTASKATGLNQWTYSGKSISIAAQETGLTGLFFSSDGTKMYVVGSTADTVFQYNLSTAWNVSTATFTTGNSLSTAAQDTAAGDIYFKPDGTAFYLLGDTNNGVYQYTIATPWVINTASYASKAFSVTTQETSPTGIWFKPDGTAMYICGTANDNINQYSLSTAWDVTTASFVQSFYLGTQDGTPNCLVFNPTGTSFYILGTTNDNVYQYNLGTAWDVSTSLLVAYPFHVGFRENTPNGLFIDFTANDRAYVGGSTSDAVSQFNTSTTAVDFAANRFNFSGPLVVQGDEYITGGLDVNGTVTFYGSSTFGNITGNQIATSTSSITLGGSVSTGNTNVSVGQTSGLITIGGTAGTGNITLGQSTAAQTLNLATGATATATTKTVNIGTAGLAGSTTTINIGSATSTTTTNIQGTLQNAGNQVLNSANYNSYSPTLTGTGASGTWGISVTGSAGSVVWSGVTGKPTTLSGYGITDAYSSSNPAGYISGITSANVTTALGYIPYNATNPSGYISGITSGMVTTALGFTPYNSTNPNGYINTAGARSAISVTGAGSYDSATGVINIVGGVTSFNTRTGAITLSSADVTGALGYTPYNSTNPSSYITSSALSPYLTSATAASTYAPLTGIGASGTWAINISGNAATATSSSGSSSVNTSSSTGVQSNYIAAINTTTPGTGTYGVNFLGSAQSDYAQGITWTWSSAGTAQAGIYVQSSGAYGTKMYFGTTDSFAVGSKTSMSIDHVGTIQVPRSYLQSDTSLRAPIFYDSNNTAYYVDPASTSTLNNVYANGQVGIGYNVGRPSSLNGTNWAARIGATDVFLVMNSLDGTASYASAIQSMRTSDAASFPLFLNPNGGYVGINTPTAASAQLHVRASTPTTIGALPSGVTMISDSSTNNYLLFRNTADNGTYSGLAFQDNNMGGYVIFGNAGGGGDQLWIAGYGGGSLQYGSADSINPAARTTTAYWNSTGFTVSSGNFYAPLWYDTQDTAYYVDPNGYSRTLFNSVYVGNEAPGAANSSADGLVLRGNYNSNTWAHKFHKYDNGSGVPLYLSTTVGASAWSARQAWGNGLNYTSQVFGSFGADDALYSPIFYDKNDTGYYVDPASTSNIYNLTIKGAIGNTTPSLVIAPTSSSGTFQWASSALSSGLGSGQTMIHVLGNAASAGNSGFIGFNYTSAGSGANYVSLGLFDNNNIFRVYYNTYSEASGSMRAPIFYDSNDTGYYVDPNGTSIQAAVTLRTGGLKMERAYTSNSIWWNGGEDTNHVLWNSYYGSNPVSRGSAGSGFDGMLWNTYAGIQIRGGSGGAFNLITAAFQGTGGDTNTHVVNIYAYGTSQLATASGYSYAPNQFRAPIFYDIDNTGYYCDLNGQSNLLGLTVNGRSLNLGVYYQGFTLDANTMDTNATGFTYAVNAPAVGPVARFSTGGGYDMWLNAAYTGGNTLYFRTRNGDAGSINSWRALVSYGINYSDSLYGTILYDANNTGYYCDPTGRNSFYQGTYGGGLQFSGSFCLNNSGANLDNSTGARLTESYGPVWNLSNGATWHHQIINGSSLCGINAGGGNFGSGNILASGNITAYYSDERLKTKITTIENALDKVKSLEGFIYIENDLARSLGYTNDKEQAGVSAQQVKAVLPQAVSLAPVDMQGVPETGDIISKSGENYLTVDYSRLVPLLVEAIKELSAQVDALKKGS